MSRDGTSKGSAIPSKYFGEESELPREVMRATLPPPARVYELERNDILEGSMPDTPQPAFLNIEFDPIVLHTVALLDYQRKLLDPAADASQLGAVPEEPTSKPSLCTFSEKDEIRLDDEVVEDILRRSVALLTAHVGFFEMESSAVNLLARITATHLKKMWSATRLWDSRREHGMESAFTSSLLQALQLQKISHVIKLKDFYDQRIRERRRRLLVFCREGREALLEPPEKRAPKSLEQNGTEQPEHDSVAETSHSITANGNSGEVNFLED